MPSSSTATSFVLYLKCNRRKYYLFKVEIIHTWKVREGTDEKTWKFKVKKWKLRTHHSISRFKKNKIRFDVGLRRLPTRSKQFASSVNTFSFPQVLHGRCGFQIVFNVNDFFLSRSFLCVRLGLGDLHSVPLTGTFPQTFIHTSMEKQTGKFYKNIHNKHPFV